jgi:hypothetical protein
MADVEADIIEDVAEACELSQFDVVTLASQIVPIDKLAELAFLTASEAEVRAFPGSAACPHGKFRLLQLHRGSVARAQHSRLRRHGRPLQLRLLYMWECVGIGFTFPWSLHPAKGSWLIHCT